MNLNRELRIAATNVLIGISLASLLASGGCSKNGGGPEPDDANGGKLTPGYTVGKAVDARGNPLEGVSIILDNTLLYNSNLVGTTDKNGTYRIKTSGSTWKALAEIRRTYNGKSYRLSLTPDNIDGYAGADGAVRNFQWNLSGEQPDNPGLFYGGSVSVNKDIESQLYDVENLEFTFTPVGELIDGSTGKILTLRTGDPHTEHYGSIPDVPIGRYKITAVHKPTGQKVKVRNRNGTYTGDGAATLDFYGETGPWACTNCMVLDYKEQ
ncbi:carboxypeptidase regulatory-like domain-containing protein [Tellurirhabdus bombi]|uniref:carboxypeptidase regulatory-like domain-containing protein n=1 Tax=Tellurirhabdus bombi TaxID=2907205 RepID=UPI001F1EC1F4|nr:carboxypeptidase regulatory-like domain-containing protein [Tellurirhabdus bombi]